MKNLFKLIRLIALVAVIGFSFAACGDGGGNENEPEGSTPVPNAVRFKGTAGDGSSYELVITESAENAGRYVAQDGDSYVLTVTKAGVTKTSSGTVAIDLTGTTESALKLILTPISGKPEPTSFTVTLSEQSITIDGTITFTDNKTELAPGPITPVQIPPEDLPLVERWDSYGADEPVKVTIDYTVYKDGVCAITVGGTAMPPLNDDGGTSGEVSYWNSVWRAVARYPYTAEAGKMYVYTFEAWTDGAERALNIQWHWDSDNGSQATGYEWDDGNPPHPPSFKITSQRKTYTIDAPDPIPISGISNLEFQCANQLGKFFVKIISIKEITFGKSGSYSYKDANGKLTIIEYTGAGGSVTIPGTIDGKTVVGIGDEVFIDRADLTSVTIPNGVTSVGKRAFEGCSSLTSVNIPNGVTSVGERAFEGCTGLASVTIPNGVTSIGNNAFKKCSSLSSVTIPNGVTRIEWGTFSDCTNLANITIPNSVISIEGWTFWECRNLTSVTIPNSVTSIGSCAFYSCSSLARVIIGSGVTSIMDWAFEGETVNLTSVTFNGTISSYFHEGAFQGDLHDKYLEGGKGTYTRASGDDTWTKQ